MKIFCSFILFAFLTYSTGANALERVLCEVRSDIDSDIGKISYEMDSDNRSIEHMYQDTFHNGQLTNRLELPADGLKNGIVLNKKDKYIILRMHSDNFDKERGGVLYLDSLYSALSGERREYQMELAMDQNGPILMINNQSFTKMNIIAKRSKVFGVIGIEKINFGN